MPIEVEKLKKLVEEKKKKRPTIEAPAKVGELEEKPEEIERVAVERIVERLRRKEAPEEVEVEARLAAIRPSVGEAAVKRKLDFSKVRFDVRASRAVLLAGSIYNTFSRPIGAFASWLGNFPLAGTLQSDLESAAIKLTVEQFLIVSVVASAGLGAMIALLTWLLAGDVIIIPALGIWSGVVIALLLGAVVFVLSGVGMLFWPSMQATTRANRINKVLPFALRQLSTQVRAGTGLHKSIRSIAHAGYGPLSEEFQRVLDEMERGASTEEALQNMSRRTRSTGLKKALSQMVRAMATGGNLSDIISSIADDISFELTMRVRDFTEKLNLVGVVYIMVSVVAPVVVAILSAVTQIPVFGGGINFSVVAITYIAMLMFLVLILVFTKRIEPE